MYEQHFGLKKPPFPAVARAADVFVGPQTASAMAGVKKGLTLQDSMVLITGPTGSGKTTVANRALDTLAGTHRSIRIGRMHLDSADVLEFLLDELGATAPGGAIRRYRALQEQIVTLNNAGQRLVIVVEDAVRMGVDTLAELEALTAADAGASAGAAVVLLADDSFRPMLQDPQLARLRQRLRQHLAIQPLSAAEMRGYCMHCFRLAGADFEGIFDDRAAVTLYALSGGVPRVSNRLIEAALAAAASRGLERIPTEFLADIAKREFGLEISVLPATKPAAPATASSRSADAPARIPDPAAPVAESSTGRTDNEPVSGSDPRPQTAIATQAPGESGTGDSSQGDGAVTDAVPEPEDDDIPDLIQDTLPDLATLSSELEDDQIDTAELDPECADGPVEAAVPVVHDEDPAEPVLELENEAEPVSESAREESIPDWDRDPTCAELMPDLDALERAMAIAHDTDDDKDVPPLLTDVVEKKPKAIKPAFEEIPEITLDNAIQQRIANQLIDEPGQVSPARDATPTAGDVSTPEIKLPPRQAKKADAELERIAAELAKAKTLEDVDDKLAETLFGEELNLIAAQVLARQPQEASANDEVQYAEAAPARTAQVAAGVAVGTSGASDIRPVEPTRPHRPQAIHSVGASAPPAAQGQAVEPAAKKPEKAQPDEPPGSIEDQITSMTQTLKALNVRPPISSDSDARQDQDDDDDDDNRKGGFFSRFRRG